MPTSKATPFVPLNALRKGSLKEQQEKVVDKKSVATKALEDRFQKELDAERDEFLPYIEKKLLTWQSDFLISMRERIQKRIPLTENMINALRKMKDKDAAYEANKNEPPKAIARITVLVKKWWANQNNLEAFTFTFDVMYETEKAYKVVGNADMTEGHYCFRCGKNLTEVASQTIGFGAICADKVGMPYPTNILTASKKEREAYKKQVRKVVENIKFEGWLPKSQVKEIIKEERF